MRMTAPVSEWGSDFDVLDAQYVADPFGIWDQLRTTCPIAHTERRGSTWLPTRYEDVTAIAHDIEHFSSLEVAVIPFEGEEPEEPVLPYGLPPISADPPLHTWTRRLLLPWFSHNRVESYEAMTRGLCSGLIDGFIADGRADAALGLCPADPGAGDRPHPGGQPRPVRHLHGVGARRAGVRRRPRPARQRRAGPARSTSSRRWPSGGSSPATTCLSELLRTEVDGAPIEDSLVLGAAALVLIAGVDTTWSAIGSSLWHLATHPDDRKRMTEDPEVMSLAVEELLRAYSPVTMARIVTADVDYAGCPMKAGDKILMNFPAANRDPEVFEHADEVILDRAHNRHVAFGSGIHRCAGSNLARMELRIALEEWLRRIPEFALADGEEVTWAGGQVRGPRLLPWCSREDPGRPRQVPGPRPVLRARPRALRGRRLRPVDRGGRRHGAARARGPGPSGHRQLPRVRHRRDLSDLQLSSRWRSSSRAGTVRPAVPRTRASPAVGFTPVTTLTASDDAMAPPSDSVSVTEPWVAGVANAHAGRSPPGAEITMRKPGPGPEGVRDGVDRDPHQGVPARGQSRGGPT